jgi:hypothetical protein
MRRYLDIPKEFPGNMSTKTTNISTLQKLAGHPLGDVASQLRSALDPESLKYNTRVSWFGAHSDELTPFLEGHLGSELIQMSLPLFSTSYRCCTERYRHLLRIVSADCFEINRKVSKQ